MERFKYYVADSLEELITLLNTESTLYSTVVYMQKQELTSEWIAVLDFAFHPVITPEMIEKHAIALSNQFQPTLSA